MSNMFWRKKRGTGANLDTRTAKSKEKDYKFEELVTSSAPVNWVEKPVSAWRKFTIRDQNGSGSCVAQSMAKLAEVSHFIKTGEKLPFSAGYYKYRSNKPQAGMGGVDAFEIWRKHGMVSEILLPSQKMGDFQMDNAEESKYADNVGEAYSIENYIQHTPADSFEDIASTIQTTGKGMMVWFYFNRYEWIDVPFIQDPTLSSRGAKTLRHSVTAVDFTLYEGKKYLIIEDSWGKFGKFKGQRLISEEFFKARNYFACYPMNFKFNVPDKVVIDKIDESFKVKMEFGARNNEVKKVQKVLKKLGYFPSNVDCTGYYGSVTARAVLKFQLDYKVDTEKSLKELNGRIIGPKTLKVLNQV